MDINGKLDAVHELLLDITETDAESLSLLVGSVAVFLSQSYDDLSEALTASTVLFCDLQSHVNTIYESASYRRSKLRIVK